MVGLQGPPNGLSVACSEGSAFQLWGPETRLYTGPWILQTDCRALKNACRTTVGTTDPLNDPIYGQKTPHKSRQQTA